jgi:hypothetical protein
LNFEPFAPSPTDRGDNSVLDTIAQPKIARRANSLWWNRDFLIIWGGQTLSAAGSFISLLALPLLVLALTGRPRAPG